MSKAASPQKRIFAIGDVHGCSHELQVLLEQLNPRPEDTVVFLGDYIDRGPDSKGVVDLVLGLSGRCEVVALKGNHESMFVDFLESPESAGAGLFVLNGGSTTLNSYAGPGGTFEIPENHVAFFYDLKLSYETEDYFFVHAGVPLKRLDQIDSSDEYALLWSRQPFLSTDFKWEKLIVHGHTPTLTPEVRDNRINVDTGCVYDGQLTAIEFPSRQFYSVPRSGGADVARSPNPADKSRVAVRFTGRLEVKANRRGETSKTFETLNYNQFGLLMKDATVRPNPTFNKGDEIEGQIGIGPSAILFKGVVARVDSRDNVRLYGVRIDRVTNGNDGREWIERPSGQ